MSRWFRFYDDAVNDPKVQRLSGDKFKAWVNLLCLASKNGGVLPPLRDIAFTLRLSDEKASSLLDYFCQNGLLDPAEVQDAPMSYTPHNWDGRQFKSDTSNERVKRHRERKCNVTVTPPETEQIQITETEKKECAIAPSLLQVLATTQPILAEGVKLETDESQYFRRAREIVGSKGGGIAKQLLIAKGSDYRLARSALELASSKGDPTTYLRGIINASSKPKSESDPNFMPGWGPAR